MLTLLDRYKILATLLSSALGAAGVTGAIGQGIGANAWAQAEPSAEDAAVTPAVGPTAAELLLEQLIEVPSEFEVGTEYIADQQAGPIVTEVDADPEEMTTPSLWWRRDQLPGRWLSPLPGQQFIQFEGYRLVTEWRAFRSNSTNAHIIDIQVDPQYWNRLGGIQQYAILNQLGTTGVSYGYHVRLYNSINLAGIYACDFGDVLATEVISPDGEIASDARENISCTATLGPFIQFEEFFLDPDSFNPP